MSDNKTYQIFTHRDLDGAVSVLTFLWSKPDATVTYREISNNEIDLIKDHVLRTCNPPKTLIMDLSLREEFLPELDQDHITFIDHHETSLNFKDKFKNAKTIIRSETSNSLLVRQLFKDSAPEFTPEQKKMILFADDHDSGESKLSESYDLNILFWTQFRNQFCYFMNYYKNGFVEFSHKQKEVIQNAKNNAKIAFMDTKMYKGDLILEGLPKTTIAAITDNYNSIVLDMIMKKYSPDVLFYINSRSEKVSIRQKKSDNPINLAAFAEKYCEGSGHQFAAGGKITPFFLEFTKKLKAL